MDKIKRLTLDSISRPQSTVLLVTFFFYFSTYFAKYNIGPSTKLLQDEFLLSNTQMGTVFTAYTAIYALGQFTAGFLGDRYSARLLLLCGALGSLTANFIFGFSSTLMMFTLAWGLNALSLSLTWGPTAGIMYAWLPERRWGTWMGLLNAICYLGSAISVPLAAGVAAGWGWRANFFVTPLMIGVMGLLVLLLVRSRPAQAGYQVEWLSPAEAQRPRVSLKDYFNCLLNSKFIMACLCMLCANFVRWGLVNWIVKILAEPLDRGGYGFSLLAAGAVGSSIHWGAALLSLTTGWLSDRVFKGQRWPLISFGFIIAGLAMFILSAGPGLMNLTGGTLLVVMLLFLAGGMIQAIMAPMCCLPGDLFGANLGGTGNGILNGVGYVGAIFAGVLLGALMDASGFMAGILSLAVISMIGAIMSFAIRR